MVAVMNHFILSMHPILEEFRASTHLRRRMGRPHETSEKVVQPEYQKSIDESLRCRNLGNEFYRLKSYDEALKLYSKSVATAPMDSEDLSLAYGNRSAVLLVLEKYDLCLLDVNRALRGQLPDSSKQKLLERRQKCWEQLQSQNEMKSKMKKAIKTKKNRALYPTERRWLYSHQMSLNETDLKIDYSSFDDPVWKTSFYNPLVPGSSKKVEFAKKSRRHLIATDDINPGEVISIQEAFALITLPEKLHIYCAYCTLRCEALIPCPTCAVEMYCSNQCRQKAYDLYHRMECKVIGKLMSVDDDDEMVKEAWLPLRMFLTGTKQGSELVKLMRNSDVFDTLRGTKNFIAVPCPTNDYFAVLSLPWNYDKKGGSSPLMPTTSTSEDVLNQQLEELRKFKTLTNLFGLLEGVNFFNTGQHESVKPTILTDLELFASLLLLHHVEAVRYYDCKLYVDLFPTPLQFTQTTKEQVARCTGILPHFMNHSCDGNTMVAYNRRKVMVFSSRPIKAGEEVFTTYGRGYKVLPQLLRSFTLTHKYHFVCQCHACLEEWPVEESVLKKKNKYLTKDKNIIQKIEKEQNRFRRILNVKSPVYEYDEKDLQRALQYSKTIRQYVEEPSAAVLLCDQVIEELMEKKGNCYVTQKLSSVSQSG